MRCTKTKTTHGDKDPNPRNKYNLMSETARVGYKYGNYIWGVTASLKSISITVGEQITVEQLIELSIVMRISRYDHVYRHHVHDK